MRARCPACHTVFRLQPEQLRAREGLVRCGFCYQAFNALEHRLATDDTDDGGEAHAAARPAPRVSADRKLPDAHGESLIARAAAASAARASTSTKAGEAPGAPAASSAPPAPSPAVLRKPRAAPAPLTDTSTLLARRDGAVAPGREEASRAKKQAPASVPPRPQPEARPVDTRVDKVHLDTTYGRLPSTVSALQRTLGGLAAGLLAGILVVQAIYIFRTEIARTLPGLRPLLVSACAPFGCTVPLPRELERISLEASDLQSEPSQPSRYLLLAMLRNRAEYPLALPHLELTLTDAADRPLARRVMPPADWLAPAGGDTAFAARSSLAVRVAFETREFIPTGYRIHVFYP